MQDFLARLSILGEFLQFLWENKLYWLLPMVIVLIIVGIFIIFGSSPVLQPFYTLF